MAKKVLVLIGPLRAVNPVGYEIEFVTPKGMNDPALPPSMDEDLSSSSLGRLYLSASCWCVNWKILQQAQYSLDRSRTLFRVITRGTQQPIVDMVNNQRIHDLPHGAYHDNFGKENLVILHDVRRYGW
jgi:hypothetical protein